MPDDVDTAPGRLSDVDPLARAPADDRSVVEVGRGPDGARRHRPLEGEGDVNNHGVRIIVLRRRRVRQEQCRQQCGRREETETYCVHEIVMLMVSS